MARERINLPEKNDRETIRKWLLDHADLSTKSLSSLSGLSVEKLIKWKIKYDVVNIRDEKLFRAWINYKDYTIAEASILLGINKMLFRRYVKKYNIKKYIIAPGKQISKTCRKYPKVDRSVLYDRESLSKLCEKYGKRAISIMTGVNLTTVQKKIKMFKLNKSDRKSSEYANSKYNTREWLYEHYVRKGYSAIKCAKIVGCNDVTISNWLAKYKIRSRDKNEAAFVRCYPENSEVLTTTE